MMYHGKLYGKLWDKYFDTDHTTDEWDAMEKRIKELEAENEKLKQVNGVPTSQKTALNLDGVNGSTYENYEEETRNVYYCNACGALEEFDCCCEDEDEWEEYEDDSLIMAASCRCGAYRIKDNKVLHVADCVCGAD